MPLPFTNLLTYLLNPAVRQANSAVLPMRRWMQPTECAAAAAVSRRLPPGSERTTHDDRPESSPAVLPTSPSGVDTTCTAVPPSEQINK